MIILDTNVLSELLKAEPAPSVIASVSQQDEFQAVSAMSIAELWQGIGYLPEERRRESLDQTLRQWLSLQPPERVLPFNAVSAKHFGTVRATRRKLGRPISVQDAMIAATCLSYEATLFTRNVQDFEGTGIEIVDPWEAV